MEKDLIKRAKKNDDEAFTELVELYRPHLTKVANGLLKGYRSFIDDALQETFIKAYLNIWKLLNVESFKPWITKILYNCCMDIIENKKDEILYNDFDVLNEFDENYESTIKDNNDDLSVLQKECNFYDTIDSLSKDEQNLITLYYYFNCDYKKIGKILNEKPGTLRMRMCRALEKLRNKEEE